MVEGSNPDPNTGLADSYLCVCAVLPQALLPPQTGESRNQRWGSLDCQVQFPARAGCNCRAKSRARDKLILNLFLAECLGTCRGGEGRQELRCKDPFVIAERLLLNEAWHFLNDRPKYLVVFQTRYGSSNLQARRHGYNGMSCFAVSKLSLDLSCEPGLRLCVTASYLDVMCLIV